MLWLHWGGWERPASTARDSKPCLRFLGACSAPVPTVSSAVQQSLLHAPGLGPCPLSPTSPTHGLQAPRCRSKCPRGLGENTSGSVWGQWVRRQVRLWPAARGQPWVQAPLPGPRLLSPGSGAQCGHCSRVSTGRLNTRVDFYDLQNSRGQLSTPAGWA